MSEEKEEKPASKRARYLNDIAELLKGKKKAAIFTHASPDPDAIGSMMGMDWLLQKMDVDADLFYSGAISHPQNRAFVNLLDPSLQDASKFVAADYDLTILVDAVPANACVDGVKFDLVIDHHKEKWSQIVDGKSQGWKHLRYSHGYYHFFRFHLFRRQ
jgi:nanoRNase/pAp phosphatase (c-di-AMP/oligoRNAs hydrolase)